MIDDEGTLSTTDVKAKFINGKPQAIEAKYSMRSQFEWDRFIRFMDRWGPARHPPTHSGAIAQHSNTVKVYAHPTPPMHCESIRTPGTVKEYAYLTPSMP